MVCLSCAFLCVLRHPRTSVLVLILPILLKAMGKQAGFCRIPCLSWVITFHLPSTACILSQMAILSSLPFSCHPSEYQTMNHRWCTSVLAVQVLSVFWCDYLSVQTQRSACLVLCRPSVFISCISYFSCINILDTGLWSFRGRRPGSGRKEKHESNSGERKPSFTRRAIFILPGWAKKPEHLCHFKHKSRGWMIQEPDATRTGWAIRVFAWLIRDLVRSARFCLEPGQEHRQQLSDPNTLL